MEQNLLTNLGASKEAFEKLTKYVDLIRQWNKAINLVAPSTLGDIWNRHILDSVQLFPHIGQGPIIDLGSGGGLPGLVLAMLGSAKNIPVTMVESDTRKCVFLREVSRETGLDNVTVINDRIENVSGITAPVITARALAPLKTLVEWASPMLAPGGRMVFLKGQDAQNELAELSTELRAKTEQMISVTDPAARIVIITP